jgi:hypothetical protein
LALISAIVISTVSFSTDSEIAIVPDSECSTPTLMVSCACALDQPRVATEAAARDCKANLRRAEMNGMDGSFVGMWGWAL